MEDKQRVELIRKANELFNGGEIEKAAAIFEKTAYRDGLSRVGDHYFFDRKLPLNALKYYRISGRSDMVNQIYDRMIYALSRWIKAGDSTETPPPAQDTAKVKLPPLKVSPKLKMAAEEILKKQE
ncbi:MAG TPA: hypothetical protein PKY31_04205 [Spirochaetota bacterium]|nr:hypothetical protein [Spirochaetota bacterium]